MSSLPSPCSAPSLPCKTSKLKYTETLQTYQSARHQVPEHRNVTVSGTFHNISEAVHFNSVYSAIWVDGVWLSDSNLISQEIYHCGPSFLVWVQRESERVRDGKRCVEKWHKGNLRNCSVGTGALTDTVEGKHSEEYQIRFEERNNETELLGRPKSFSALLRVGCWTETDVSKGLGAFKRSVNIDRGLHNTSGLLLLPLQSTVHQ